MSIQRRHICCKDPELQRSCPWTQPRSRYALMLLVCSWRGHRWDHGSDWWRMCGRCLYDETTEDE